MIFIDFETRSSADLTLVGSAKYAADISTEVLCMTYAEGDGAPQLWLPGTPKPKFQSHLVAWNAAFDRRIFNRFIEPTSVDRWLCAQAQAEASGLPGGLAGAAKFLAPDQLKDDKGKALLKVLANGNLPRPPPSDPRWTQLYAYALQDIEAMRAVFKRSRPLTAEEWTEYWASERINDVGIPVDTAFARQASKLAEVALGEVNARLEEITGISGITVNHHLKKRAWLTSRLPPDVAASIINEDGNVRGDKHALASLKDHDIPPDVEAYVEAMADGSSAAHHKYARLAASAIDGRVRGAYSFSGAHTGRFTSRGVQFHNFIRDTMDEPEKFYEFVKSQPADAAVRFIATNTKLSPMQVLARLLRPTVRSPGRVLVWSDWSSIEARMIRWLAKTPRAEQSLDVFRRGEDLYLKTAEGMFRKPVKKDDPERQIGKVAELALSYGGGAGAFRSMGKNYGLKVTDAEARLYVDLWRGANEWAKTFWYALSDAAFAAMQEPLTWFTAGRVGFRFIPSLMRGTLVCRLASGRWIVYPEARVKYEPDDLGKPRRKLTYAGRGKASMTRFDIYYGILAENATQAECAVLLRQALVKVPGVIAHTHDEIVLECAPEEEEDTKCRILRAMTDVPIWAAGLPLAASVKSGPFLTK
jgi:DNA polymerase